ncbi:MAG: hypothetical protein KKH68_04335 [Proteobacteria bacterium]|nr:hypothetical protein [Pseudomonadota bacterium]
MSLYDLTDFLKLSSALNYNLSATSLNRYNVLMYMIGGKRLHPDEARDRENKGVVMEALSFVFNAYREKRRRLGPLAVLHPLRATALLARSLDILNLTDLLTALFHDVLEDINPVDFKLAEWKAIEQQFYSLLGKIHPEDEWNLANRLKSLTRLKQESYYQYIGRLLDDPNDTFKLVQVKLADRLDNTLDMHVDLIDPLEGIDFFQIVFQLLFVNNYHGFVSSINHPPPTAINGAKRLYQLFKNAVLLSLIRQKITITKDLTAQALFDAICQASLKEAQRTLIHLICFHFPDVLRQRALLLEAMDYCYSGRSDMITPPDSNIMLDGLFSSYFGPPSDEIRKQRLDILYQNKPLMIQASIGFMVIFLSFINDPEFYIKGISVAGIEPDTT